jgi:hypothetical protein
MTFWQFTWKCVKDATREYFAPLFPVKKTPTCRVCTRPVPVCPECAALSKLPKETLETLSHHLDRAAAAVPETSLQTVESTRVPEEFCRS